MSHDWTAQKERANVWAVRLLMWIVQHLGRSLTQWLLWPLVGYYLLSAPTARRASKHYLRRVLGRPLRWTDALRHFHCFASCATDRVLLIRKARGLVLDSAQPGRAHELARQGCLLLTCHVGSFEALRQLGGSAHRLPLRLVLDRQHGRIVTELLERMDPQLLHAVIDASQRGPALALAIGEALSSGVSVGLMADRPRGGEATLSVDLLGSPAKLPAAPWIFASVLKVPVVAAFCTYEGGGRYRSHYAVIAERIDAPRRERDAVLQRHAQAYADLLTQVLRQSPYNWFNFYDFWDDSGHL